MPNAEKPRDLERPYRPDVGNRLWEEALQQYAHPDLQRRIREEKGFALTANAAPTSDMSRDLVAVRENIMHFLIAEAAKYLSDAGKARISVSDISQILTSDKFSVSSNTIREYLDKFPHLVNHYRLFKRAAVEINQRYKESILEVWRQTGRRPHFNEIAELLGLTSKAVRQKLQNMGTAHSPDWLIKLFEEGPSKKNNG